MKIISYLLVVFATLTLIACNSSKNQDNVDKYNSENPYKNLGVSKMIQYAHDLAFIKVDEIGRPIQTTYFDSEGRITKIERYDISGDICDSKKYSSDKTQTNETLENTQIKNDSLTVKIFNPQGELLNKITHTYNGQGKKTSRIKFDNHERLIEKTTYTYYENGLIKQDIYWNTDIDKPEQIINYKYEFY